MSLKERNGSFVVSSLLNVQVDAHNDWGKVLLRFEVVYQGKRHFGICQAQIVHLFHEFDLKYKNVRFDDLKTCMRFWNSVCLFLSVVLSF